MKVCYFDCETTGIDPEQQDILQFAYLVEIDGEIKIEGSMFMQPFVYETISPEALKVNNLTVEQIKTYDPPEKAYQEILKVFGGFVDKFDRSDKFYPAGYNVDFDMRFLRNFFLKNHDNYFGSWFNWHRIDPLQLLYWLEYAGKISLPNYKLQTVCDYFAISFEAHEALSDIKATRRVIKLLQAKYFG